MSGEILITNNPLQLLIQILMTAFIRILSKIEQKHKNWLRKIIEGDENDFKMILNRKNSIQKNKLINKN